jgi:hypothetical protein
LIGNPPAEGNKYQAHHVFPQTKEFDSFFKSYGLDKHDAKFGSWVEKHKHLSDARAYNDEWRRFINNGTEKTLELVLDFGRKLANKFGYKINF